MNKNLDSLLKGIKVTMVKRSPEILTGIGIAGMITTTILAVRSTPKALKMLEDAEYDKGEKLTVGDKFKASWKCYIPAAVTGIASMACIIFASSVNVKRNAALATAYSLSETALREYQEKVVETIGEKKEKAIKEKIDKDHLEKNPVSSNDVIITKKGDTLCYDRVFGRYFKSDIDSIKRAINEVNRTIVTYGYVSLNEFYSELGLIPTDSGDELGWNIDDRQVDIDFSSQLADDGTPCLVISYSVAPKFNFDRL